jgi:sugar lactone lactonase YvrE
MASDPDGSRIYASVPSRSEVLVLSLDGARLATLPVADDSGQPLADATSIALSPDRGTLYVLDSARCRVSSVFLP